MSKRRRIGRSWISLLLVLVMMVQLLPASVMAAGSDTDPGTTTVASGSCGAREVEDGPNGTNATWVLTTDNTLTISGTGTIDYSSEWHSLQDRIRSVVIGEGITGLASVNGWWNVKTLSLPASLTSFSPDIIRNCDSIESITLAEGSATYKMENGALLSKDGTVLYWYPANYAGNTYAVPEGVKTIGDYAVYGHGSLTTITLPEGLVTIGNHAFNSCNRLNCTLTIPASVKTMGKYCMSYINELKIIIPENSVLETIGEGAMSDNYTEELTLPATLKSVGARSLPFGLKSGAILTFLSRDVVLAADAIPEQSTVYGYPGSTVEAYANAVNNNGQEWDDINFIPLEVNDPDLSGQGKTIGFLPGLVDSRAPDYATEINGAREKSMGFVDEKSGISLVSGSVKDEKDAVLTKLSFKLQIYAFLIDSEQPIPQPSFQLSSAKDAATTLSVIETTTADELASGARWYTVTMEGGSFSDGEIVLTCAYDPGQLGWYSTYIKDVKAVYAYADGSKTGSEVQPARVASNSFFTIDRFQVGGGTAVEIVPGGLNTESGAASLFDGGWKRGCLPAEVDGKPAIYQTADRSATVSLKLTADTAQQYYSKTTVKCYLSDSAENYASGRILKETSFTAGEELSSMEALVKAHPIQLTLPTQAAGIKYLTAEVSTLYALNGKSGSVVKTHTAAIVTKAANDELYTVGADGVLSGYDGSESSMTLPAAVGVTAVKTVGVLADGNQYGTEAVIASAGIEKLADNALKNFRELTAVQLPESIRSIGSGALATGSAELTLRIDSADPKLPTFAEDAVDLSTTKLTVQCYSGSAAEAWANALREAYPDRVTVTILDASRMLRLEIKNTAGQTLGQDSFTSVEWFREGSDAVLGRGISYILPENAVIDEAHRYVCRVTFSPAIRFDYTVPVTMSYTFDSFGAQSYQLPPREKNITVKGSFARDQVDSSFSAYIVVQEPSGELRVDLPITQANLGFSVPLSGKFPTVLYARNDNGGDLVMADVQSRPTISGVVDLGEIALPNRNIQQTIESEAVNVSYWGALSSLVNRSGSFVLLDEDGNEFTDFVLTMQHNSASGYSWLVLKLGSSVRDAYFVGDKLTLHQITDESTGYRIQDAVITLQLKTETAADFPLVIDADAQLRFRSNIYHNDYYVFDEAGTLLCERPRSRVYLVPGVYTVIGLRKNSFISSISTPTELEEIGIPAANYLKETVALEKGTEHYVSSVPDFLSNTITLTVTADEQMMTNGLVPVYIRYHNQRMEQHGLDQEWTLSIASDDSDHNAALPLEQLEGRYAYSTEGTLVGESISRTDGGYSYEQLELKVRGAEGTICLYAQATGRTLVVKAGEESTSASITLPRESISVIAPEMAAAQADGELHLYARLPQSSGISYSGRVYVDNELQNEKSLTVFGTGENLLPYHLERYSDGTASHTVRAEVWQKTNDSEERIWSSDDYRVLLLPTGEAAPQPVSLSMRMFMERANYPGNLQLSKNFNLQSGSYGKLNYTLYPVDFNADNTLKNDMVLDYQLTMLNPERVRNGRVILRVYSGSESEPTITDLILRQNPTTGTFDGTLTLEGGAYSIGDVPFGYDLRYYSDAEMSISMDQLAEQIEQRKEDVQSLVPEDSMMPTEPVDMEQLEHYLLQLPDSFTEESKQKLRDICIMHNEWCQSLEDERAALAEIFELTTGTGVDDWDSLTTEDILALVAELSGGMAPELLEEGDELLDREYLLSHGYLQAGDTGVYVYEDKTSDYVSAVDIEARVHTCVGELPRQGIMSRSRRIDAVEFYRDLESVYQTISMVAMLVSDGVIKMIEESADFARAMYDFADYQSFMETNLVVVDNLEEVLRGGVLAVERMDTLTVMEYTAKQVVLDFKASVVGKNIQGIKAAVEKFEQLDFVKYVKGLPLDGIGAVVTVFLDFYEVICFEEELRREIDNCFKDIDAAQAYLARLQAEANSSEECREALAAYLPECIEAVDELVVDAEDIIRTQKGRMFGRIQTLLADCWLGALGSILPKNIELFADVANFAVGNASEAMAYMSLVKNMHELDADWEDVQESCIDPLYATGCNRSDDDGDSDDDSDSGGSDGDGGGGYGDGERPDIYVPQTPVIDPAGYVYEAVASNRIEGAAAQIWYRDESGNAVAWTEAPEYGEVDTQITGADGRFSWMTPPGRWLVTVSKAGYESADSKNDPAAEEGWLPVPPPQLNVNIGLTSLSAPAVESAQAAADVIRVVFSQYMDIAQFEGGALLAVTQSGEPVTVTVGFADSELSPTGDNVYYGRVMELRRADGESFAEGVSLSIDRTAKNYAGTPMTETYSSGSMSVQSIPGSIVHSYPNRFVTGVGEQGALAVQVLDTTGRPLAGVTVKAVQQLGGTLELAETAVSDSNGRAAFAVKGLTAGYDAVIFTAGTVSGTMNTRVAPISTTAPKKPAANLADYQVVSAGTQLIITAQQGAVIRYTTNNTCPCTDEALTYTGPITLSEEGEYFFRIAAWTQAGGYSERLNLHITVQSGGSSGGIEPGGSGTTSGGAQPAEKPAQEPQFTDVHEDAYYFEAVRWAVENGITDGVGGGRFDPDAACTRAQIVTFLWRAAGSPEPKSVSSFVDVPADAYYAAAVAWAVENGITDGVGGGRFAPDQPCTRAQSVTFLYRAAGAPAAGVGAAFNDVAADDYYASAVAWAAQQGITDGVGGGMFGSELECSRAQIVTFLYRSAVKK